MTGKLTSDDEDLQLTLGRLEAALDAFVRGDAVPFKALWSHGQDVSILGGWGAYEIGWGQVGPRLEWAAGRFSGGELSYDRLAVGSSGDLSYVVHIERGNVQTSGALQQAPMMLRVTHILRREEGSWKVIHRHADPIIRKTEVEAVLQGNPV